MRLAYRLLNDASAENADVEAIKKQLDRIGVIPREKGTKGKAGDNNSRRRRSLCSSLAETRGTLIGYGVSFAMMASTTGAQQEAGDGASSFFRPSFSAGF